MSGGSIDPLQAVTGIFGNGNAGSGGGGLYQLLDPLGVAGMDNGALDPLNLFPTNQPGGANYQQKNGTPLPSTLTPNGSTTPIFTSPLSWAPRQPTAPGAYNAMATQLAGPVYTGGLQIPGVSPALLNQPLGAQGKGGAAAGNTPVSPPTGLSPVSIQQKLAALRAGGLNNGFMPAPGSSGVGLSPRGTIQAF